MKLFKYLLSAIIFLVMLGIVILITPIFLLLDGGIEILKMMLEPTVFGKTLSERVKA